MTRRSAGKARFAFPPDLARTGVEPAQMDLAPGRAALRPQRSARARRQPERGYRRHGRFAFSPGGGSSGGRGFFAWVDASSPRPADLVEFAYGFRGNAALGLEPEAGETHWKVHRLAEPELRRQSSSGRAEDQRKGFDASYRSAIWRWAGRWSAPPTRGVSTSHPKR